MRCATFKVSFDSLIQITPGEGSSGSWNLEYGTEPIVTPDVASAFAYASGDTTGAYKSVSGAVTVPVGGSVTALSGTGGDFRVLRLTVPIAALGWTEPTLVVSVGQTSEEYAVASGGMTTNVPGHDWWANFMSIHPLEASAEGAVTVLPLQYLGGDGSALMAQATFNGSQPADGGVETTTV